MTKKGVVGIVAGSIVGIGIIGSVASNNSTTKSRNDKDYVSPNYTYSATTNSSTTVSKTETSSVKIVSHEFAKDYKDRDVLVVEYEWTNTDDEPTSYLWSVSDKVYQNGISLETATSVDGVDSSNKMSDVQPGYKINVKTAYILQDRSTATVECRKLITDDLILKEDIDLGGGAGNTTPETSDNSSNSESSGVKVVSHEFATDRRDRDVLIVEYEWTNTDDTPRSFLGTIEDNVFQNGISLETSFSVDGVDAQMINSDVQPGYTINVKQAYLLQDRTTATVECTTWITDNLLLREDIDLGGGAGTAPQPTDEETSVKFTDAKVIDYDGKKVLIASFDYHNGNKGAEMFGMDFRCHAFQNGIECKDFYGDIENEHIYQPNSKVQAGITCNVHIAWYLNDSSDVTLNVTDFMGNKQYINETIKVS